MQLDRVDAVVRPPLAVAHDALRRIVVARAVALALPGVHSRAVFAHTDPDHERLAARQAAVPLGDARRHLVHHHLPASELPPVGVHDVEGTAASVGGCDMDSIGTYYITSR